MKDSVLAEPLSPPRVSDGEVEAGERLSLIIQNAINEVPGSTYAEKLKHLNQCRCCIRHQLFRPNVLEHWEEGRAFACEYVGWGEHDTACNCNCRHMARMICRQVPRA